MTSGTIDKYTSPVMNNSDYTTRGSSETKKQTLSDTFLSLLLTQLQNQNPMEPMDEGEMIAQLASMNTVEQLEKMNTALTSLVSSNTFSSAASLIGKEVTYKATNSEGETEELSGVVTEFAVKNGSVMLTVGDAKINMAYITGVKQASGDD